VEGQYLQKMSRHLNYSLRMVPNIDYGLCQGCGGCSDLYPRFFELRGEKAWVINADEFNADKCPGVLTVCPYYAITLEEI